MVIKVAGHEYCVTNEPKRHARSLSFGSIADVAIEVEKTKIKKDFHQHNFGNLDCSNLSVKCDSNGSNYCSKDNSCEVDAKETTCHSIGIKDKDNVDSKLNVISKNGRTNDQRNPKLRASINNQIMNLQITDGQSGGNALSKSKSEGNPFQHGKKGKIIRVNRTNRNGKSIFYNLTLHSCVIFS